MPTRRQYRVNELLREELQLLIPGRLDDPRLIGATVTRVHATQDLSTAKVYIATQGDDAEAAAILEALAHASHFLRSQISDLGLRRVPELVFARDRQYESGERILDILAALASETAPVAGSESTDGQSGVAPATGSDHESADAAAPTADGAAASRERPRREHVDSPTAKSAGDDSAASTGRRGAAESSR